MNKEAHYDHLHTTGQLKGIGFRKRSKMWWEAVKDMSLKRKMSMVAPGVTMFIAAVILLIVAFA